MPDNIFKKYDFSGRTLECYHPRTEKQRRIPNRKEQKDKSTTAVRPAFRAKRHSLTTVDYGSFSPSSEHCRSQMRSLWMPQVLNGVRVGEKEVWWEWGRNRNRRAVGAAIVVLLIIVVSAGYVRTSESQTAQKEPTISKTRFLYPLPMINWDIRNTVEYTEMRFETRLTVPPFMPVNGCHTPLHSSRNRLMKDKLVHSENAVIPHNNTVYTVQYSAFQNSFKMMTR